MAISIPVSVLLSMSFVSSSYSDPTPLTGVTKVGWATANYSGSTSGVTLDLNGTSSATGDISFSLDASFNDDNYYLFNWSAGTASIRLHLLADSPLLSQLGIGQVPIEINESGPLSNIPLVEPDMIQNILFPASVSMTGGGTIQQGLLSGIQFSNDNIWIQINNSGTIKTTVGGEVDVNVPVNVNMQSTSQHSGTITQPNGMPQSTHGIGEGVAAAPTPAAVWLFGSGLIGLMGLGRKRKAI